MNAQQKNGLCAVILAAGSSTRMEPGHKLLLPFEKRSMVETVVATMCAIPFLEIRVVLGAQSESLSKHLSTYEVTIVENRDYALGMGHSLARGIVGANAEAKGFLVALADMPLIKLETIAWLCDAFQKVEPDQILAPVYGKKRGHPVIFSQSYRRELQALTGDVGARGILKNHVHRLHLEEVQDSGVLRDIDSWQDYEEAREIVKATEEGPEIETDRSFF